LAIKVFWKAKEGIFSRNYFLIKVNIPKEFLILAIFHSSFFFWDWPIGVWKALGKRKELGPIRN